MCRNGFGSMSFRRNRMITPLSMLSLGFITAALVFPAEFQRGRVLAVAAEDDVRPAVVLLTHLPPVPVGAVAILAVGLHRQLVRRVGDGLLSRPAREVGGAGVPRVFDGLAHVLIPQTHNDTSACLLGMFLELPDEVLSLD